jgi:hypothetical protein
MGRPRRGWNPPGLAVDAHRLLIGVHSMSPPFVRAAQTRERAGGTRLAIRVGMRKVGFAGAWLLTLLGVAVGLSSWLGWIELGAAISLGMGAVALVGLWLVVWLPWDLYFAARQLIEEQRDSLARNIEVMERDRASAARLAPRLLALCLSLHVGAAGILALATWASGGSLGYWFAGSFLLSMGLRPLGSLHRHVGERLASMRRRAAFPRQDVRSLIERVDAAEVRLGALDLTSESLQESLTVVDRDGRVGRLDLERKLDELVVELERSMAKLTHDRELLQGVKALVRVIKHA